jgi:hypothetical protein
VAVLDADVLVPILSSDLLLSAFDADLYQPVVTATILGEVERTLYADFGHLDPVALRRRVRQVRTGAGVAHPSGSRGDRGRQRREPEGPARRRPRRRCGG